MMNFEEWLDELAGKTPALRDSITKLDPFIDNGRLKAADLEAAIERLTIEAVDAARNDAGENSHA